MSCDHRYSDLPQLPVVCLDCGYIHECEHGSLKRKCEICQRDEEIAELRELKALAEEAGKKMLQREAQLQARIGRLREALRYMVNQECKHGGLFRCYHQMAAEALSSDDGERSRGDE